MITLPSPATKMWLQNNRSDVLGTLWSSFNLNLTEQLGKTKVSPRMVITTNGITNLGTPVAFREYSGDLYCVAGSSSHGYVFRAVNGLCETAFAVDAQTGTPGDSFKADFSDMEVFNGLLFVTTSTDGYYRLSSGTWTGVSSLLTSNTPHKMLNFTLKNRLYIQATYGKIISLNTSYTAATSGSNTITLANTDLVISSMIQTSDLIWILTFNQYNNQGFVYTWDGVTADTWSSAIPLDSRGALAGVVKDGTPYIIDTDGKLMKYNGQSFIPEPNGQLPVRTTKYLTNPISVSNNRWIHPNGISLVNGRINILINNLNYDNAGTINEALPSGIWEYVENGADSFWYHKSALTQYDLSGSASITDYGQNRISRVGALFNVKKDDNTSATFVGTMLAGADYYTDATTVKSAVFTNDSLDLIQKRGYAVTSKILPDAKSIQENWAKLYMRIRPLLNSTDRIYLKTRTNDDVATEVTITWLSANSFTTTGSVAAYAQGNEVEILQGQGSGWCPNIQSITSNGAGTHKIVLDESFATALSGTAKARFQTWTTAGTFSSQKFSLASFSPKTTPSAWIQIKACFLYTGDNEMIDMMLINTPFQ